MIGTGAGRRQQFASRAALVTGAGGGSGLAVARALADEGADVLGVDLKPRPADFPGAGAYIQGDVTDAELPAAAVRAAVERFGGVDLLVNAAGVAWFDRDASAADLSDEVWDRVLAINLTAAMRFARAAVPELRRRGGGAMVHVASVAGLRGMDAPMDAYQVSKAGLISLSRGLAMALAQDGVRSNAVCPGAIDTPMLADIYAQPERRAAMAARTPIGRVGEPADVAAACMYLLSDDASFVTGTELVVDGGWLAVLP
jgi:NAD(P)-dependent dehydrogenase (short-subunit alcohol dehydrogenase family)